MQEPPFQRITKVLSVIAAELSLFSYFPVPPALVFLLSTFCFTSRPLSPAVFPTLKCTPGSRVCLHIPTCVGLTPQTGVTLEWVDGTYRKSLLKAVVCLAHKTDGFATGALGKQGHTWRLEGPLHRKLLGSEVLCAWTWP